MRCLLLLSLLCAYPAALLTIQDSLYEETLRSALPYAAPWAAAPALPTGWAALPGSCASITSLVLAPVAYLSTGTQQARAVALCRDASGQASLLDALTRSPFALPGQVNASLPWVLAGPAAAAAASGAALPVLALSGCPAGSSGAPASLLQLACSLPNKDALGGGACQALPVVLPNVTLPCDPAQVRLWVHGPLPGAPATAQATLWLSSPALGTLAYALDAQGASLLPGPVFTSPAPTTAVAFSAPLATLALGNASSLAILTAAAGSLALARVEWATDDAAGWGGPIDDAVTALLWDDRSGRDLLYIATPTALNIYKASTGLIGRLAGRDGLPATNITSLALDATLEGRVWLGTTTGIVLYDDTVAPTPPLPPSLQAHSAAAAASAPPEQLPWRTRWRFFSGARWLPPASPATPTATGCAYQGGPPFPLLALPPGAAGGSLLPSAPSSSSLAWPHTLGRLAGPNASAWAVGGGEGALVSVTVGGLGVLASSQWTLQSKAAYYEAQLPLFDLAGPLASGGTGLVGGAGCPAFGAWDSATTSPDDNNGLWSSLLVTAFSAKANLTRQPAAAALASSYLQGLLNLNAVTGIQGLFARSTLPPGHGLPSPDWRNSSARPGWVWKGDTSSDETAGHVCAYSAVGLWLGEAAPAAAAAAGKTLVNFCRYVVLNNLTLIDTTGQRTTWGFWDIPTINFSRRYSDTRGVNSAEALAMLLGALVGSQRAGSGAASNDTAAFTATLDLLLSPAVGYHQNLRNLKIAAPIDDNFSGEWGLCGWQSCALTPVTPPRTLTLPPLPHPPPPSPPYR